MILACGIGPRLSSLPLVASTSSTTDEGNNYYAASSHLSVDNFTAVQPNLLYNPASTMNRLAFPSFFPYNIPQHKNLQQNSQGSYAFPTAQKFRHSFGSNRYSS